MSFKKLVLTTALLSISFSAYSQDSSVEDTGWFVGGSLGQFKAEFETGYNEKDNGLGIYGGYNFNKWFGLEGSFGSVEYGDADFSIGNLSVAPKLTLVINDVVSLYAKVGLSTVALIDDEYDEDWSGVGATYGVGAQFGITKGLKLRIGYDLIDVTLENDDYDLEADTDLTQTTLGVHYQF